MNKKDKLTEISDYFKSTYGFDNDLMNIDSKILDKFYAELIRALNQ